ncbi:MAG: hypothetical protein AAB865_02775 [Patescibacteria group bacterium]
MFLAIALAACQNPTTETEGTHTDVTSTSSTTVAATLASVRTLASLGDEMVDTTETSTSGIAVKVTGDGATYYVDTTYKGQIAEGATATIDHYEGSVHFVSNPVTVGSDETVLRDCVDLAGEWACGTNQTSMTVNAQTSCTPSSTLTAGLSIDGFHLWSDDIDGIISEDGKTITYMAFGNDGSYMGTSTCTRK